MDVHMNWKAIKTVLALLTSALLVGCASTPPVEEADEFALFYDGESEVSYATAFPVGTPEEAYRNGDAAARSGDHDRALFEYIRGLRTAEEPNLGVLYKIGSIHYGRDNHRLADLAYRWVLETDPDHVLAGTGLGLVLLQRRQYEAAKTQLGAVLAAPEQVPWRAYNAMGILADMDGAAEEAESYYQQALGANPGSPLILNNLGYSRYLFGDWAGASTALQRAVRIDANYELAWRNLGLVHARQKNFEFALEALGRSSNASEAYNDVGFVSMLEGDYSQALSFFNEAMRLSPAYYITASENANNVKRMLNRKPGSKVD